MSDHLKIVTVKEPHVVLNDVESIRKWLHDQPHLVINTQDDHWILTFLRCCNHDLEKTKHKIDNFFLTKTVTPEFFDGKDSCSPVAQEILKQGACIPIKSTTGPTKILIIWRKVDPNVVTFNDLFKYGLMLYDIFLEQDDDFVISGQEILHDMKDFPVAIVKQMNPLICKKSMYTILDAYPSTIKEIAFFNSPPTYELFTKLFEPFLSHEIKNKVTIHKGGLEDVYNKTPLTEFPKEYGGENDTIEEIAAKWKTRFEAYKPRFLEEAQYRSEETKRKGGPKTSADVYDIEQSFGNLEID